MSDKKTTVVNLNYEKYDVYIGRKNKRRGLEASQWGNPFFIGKDGTRKEVIEKYRQYLLNNEELLKQIPKLKGKVLGCYCKPLPCHGDVLAELANSASDEINQEEKGEVVLAWLKKIRGIK